MNTSKRSKTRPDRLSELPESLIFHIFWLLPMRDAVKTAVLSKQWRKLWITMPCLNIDNNSNSSRSEFREFVYRALMIWRGNKIQKLKIDLSDVDEYDQPSFKDLDAWLYIAKEHNVEELYLDHKIFANEAGESYDVPPYLFSSCPSLKVLWLRGCNLQIRGNLQWNKLKRLSFNGGAGLSHRVISKVLSGCPRLEEFFLTINGIDQFYEIRSSSLKTLSIDYVLRHVRHDPRMDTELRIWTQNLETLEISGFPYRRCLLKDISSLSHLTLGFHRHHLEFFENDFLEETLTQIFPTILHVQNVTLSDWCIKVLGEMRKKKMLSTLMWNVMLLKLVKDSFVEHELVGGLLEIFPSVKILVLEEKNKEQYDGEHCKFDAKSHLTFPSSFLRQLRTFTVTWAEGDNSIFPLIQIVFKYASKLEKMVFRLVEGNVASDSLVLASQKLLRMQRSSPTAELIFCENWSSSWQSIEI